MKKSDMSCEFPKCCNSTVQVTHEEGEYIFSCPVCNLRVSDNSFYNAIAKWNCAVILERELQRDIDLSLEIIARFKSKISVGEYEKN
jgi:hypothetical protein